MNIRLQKPFVLASGSLTRRALLEQAGIVPEIYSVDLDEEALRCCETEKGTPIKEIAVKLAEAKAEKAAAALPPDRIILAADQILELEGRIFSKPETREEAVTHLQELRGKTHCLQTAMVLHSGGKIIWKHVSAPELHMRALSDSFIRSYVAAEGDNVLQSVGAYRIEALGIHLFSQIKGERSAILGLPILPLLEALRQNDVLADKF